VELCPAFGVSDRGRRFGQRRQASQPEQVARDHAQSVREHCVIRIARARVLVGVEIGERQDAVPRPGDRLVTGEALELRQQLVETALLAPQRHELRREVCTRLRGSRPFGQSDRVARQPLGLAEAARQRQQHASPHERRMPVQRLLELHGKELKLAVPTPSLIQLSELREVVEQPVAGERARLDLPEFPRHGQRLLGEPATLQSMVRVQQRRVEPHQCRRECLGFAKPPRHLDRLDRQLARACRGLGRYEVLGLTRQQPHAKRAVARRQFGERLVKNLDLG
jgi:hypothetical protein